MNEANTIEIVAVRESDNFRMARPVIHHRETMTEKARMAAALLERWAPIAGTDDGEDSAGRAKIRRLNAAEVVEHACEIADRAIDSFRARGWMKAVPSLSELEAQHKAKDKP